MREPRGWFWAARSMFFANDWIYIWPYARPKPRRPDLRKDWFYVKQRVGENDSRPALICADAFERVTGLTLPIDKPVKVKIEAEIMDE